MSEIPEDIKRSAEQAANEVVGLLDEFGAAMPHVRSIIARYLLAERRRCAEAYMHWARKMMEEVEGRKNDDA